MNEIGIPTTLWAWVWWFFTVVIVAIFINVLSSYLKTYVDGTIYTWISDQKVLGAERERVFSEEVERMLAKPAVAIEVKRRYIRDWLVLLGLVVLTIFIIYLGLDGIIAKFDTSLLLLIVGFVIFTCLIAVSFLIPELQYRHKLLAKYREKQNERIRSEIEIKEEQLREDMKRIQDELKRLQELENQLTPHEILRKDRDRKESTGNQDQL